MKITDDTTIIEIIEAALRESGYDGLYSEDGECACRIGDLIPYDCVSAECRPGVVGPCDPRTCPEGGGCDWHIGRRPA